MIPDYPRCSCSRFAEMNELPDDTPIELRLHGRPSHRITHGGIMNTPEQARNFDQAFADAMAGEPQVILKYGEPVAVLMRYDEWEWMKAQIKEES